MATCHLRPAGERASKAFLISLVCWLCWPLLERLVDMGCAPALLGRVHAEPLDQITPLDTSRRAAGQYL